jgi:hypothetical protein
MQAERLYIRQLRAAMVAEYALQARLDKLRWEEETLLPALEEAKQEIGRGGELPQITVSA